MVTIAHDRVGSRGFVPALAQPWIRRPRLLERLRNRPQVVIAAAPPGSGKTALLAEWVGESNDVPVAWLSLDARDNCAGRVATFLAWAVGAIDDIAPSHDVSVDLALESAARADRETVIILDDVHELTDRDALAALDHFLLRAPRSVSVVLAGRADPPVALPRLNLEGRLVQIRARDLAFTVDEAKELFRVSELALTAADIETLWARTEGWIAGLRLAALALATESDPARFVADAACTEAVVSDYLLSEVFRRQPRSVQDFLLKTSVADRLPIELAEVLSGDDDAIGRLRALEHDGVFLTAVDASRSTYRYHSLFGALLRAHLRENQAGQGRELARRAALWFAEHDMPVEAERHAARARDWALLGQFAGDRWLEAVVAGEVDRTPFLLDAPTDAAEQEPALALLAFAGAVSRGDRTDAQHRRARCRSGAATDTPRLAILRSFAEMSYGRAFGATDEALDAATNLARLPAVDGLRLQDVQVTALFYEAQLRLDRGETDASVALFEKARNEAMAASPAWIEHEADAWLALTAAVDGRLADAEHAVANRPEGVTTPADDVARTLTRAICDAGRGRTAHALAAVSDLQAPRSRSQILRATTSLALDALQQRSIRRHAPLTNPFLADLCAALGAVDLLVEHPTTTAYPVERSLARGRRLFTTARDDDAILDALVPLTDVACHPRSQVELYTLCALAADRTGRDQSALDWLRRALARAFADDLRAPFMGYGRAAATLLERYAWQLGEHRSYAVAVLEDVRQSDPPVFVETLTNRELAVLEYLPTMMSNVEIARQLYVSVNTVKTHLKSVYRKLGVERRRDAVVRARQLEIL